MTKKFILLLGVNDDLFNICFGDDATWPCEFRTLGENCSAEEASIALNDPDIVCCVFQDEEIHWELIKGHYNQGGYVVYFGIEGLFDIKFLNEGFGVKWQYSAYTSHEHELTPLGIQLLGDGVVSQKYTKTNMFSVPVEDRILIGKRGTLEEYLTEYAGIEISDGVDNLDDDEREEYEEARDIGYPNHCEEMENHASLALHVNPNHGGRIAYLGFVNDDGNIPKFVKALLTGKKTQELEGGEVNEGELTQGNLNVKMGFARQFEEVGLEGDGDNEGGLKHQNLIVLQSKALVPLFTKIRDRDTSSKDFVTYSKRIMRLLAEEAIAYVGTTPYRVMTPTNVPYAGLLSIVDTNPDMVCAVSIVRAGDSLLESVRDISPGIRVGKLWIQRNESVASKEAVHSCTKLPKNIHNMDVILCDPMLATGGSSITALDILVVEYGVDPTRIVFANVICCPEGLEALAKKYPTIKIVTCWIDSGMNSDKYIRSWRLRRSIF